MHSVLESEYGALHIPAFPVSLGYRSKEGSQGLESSGEICNAC
jgi:hypothetical protein